jgi:hypothetical protein
MPLHEYIKQIYEKSADSLYIIRFLDYLVSKRYKRTTFAIKGQVVEPLITGILENVKTKERYYSLPEFYTKTTGKKINETDINLLSILNVTTEYTIMRLICNATELDILGFFDQKYRIFLLHRDLRKQIKNYTPRSTITLIWNNDEYEVSRTKIVCNDITNSYKVYDLLDAYEAKRIEGLYYNNSEGRQLVIV